jgi:hypothetical protein
MSPPIVLTCPRTVTPDLAGGNIPTPPQVSCEYCMLDADDARKYNTWLITE